jgi:hypothetical protein
MTYTPTCFGTEVPSSESHYDKRYTNQPDRIQWGMLQQTMLQRKNAKTNRFYQQNQDATTNTVATTNAEEYYRPT